LTLSIDNCIKVINVDVEPRIGYVRHVLFDFDGTLSVLRQGWEPVMEAVMLASISPNREATPELVAEVREYIDASTGQLTILQMGWLADAVRRYGYAADPLTPYAYKQQYRKALMVSVSERLDRLETGQVHPEEYLMAGAADFVQALARRGVHMYLASGSDHPDVVREATALGLAPYLAGGIYGALDASEANAKDKIMQRILDDHNLSGDELLVVGDGPVEIIEARARRAIALGIASDEVARRGWNQHKIERLTRAGADLLIADFSCSTELVDLLIA
jgi:phosphoglycolate phosphatase-like HAD superfamily hydrolase